MRNHAAYAAVLTALLFVGAGCATSVDTKTGINGNLETEGMMKEEEGGAIDIDAEVDAIIDDAGAEKDDQYEADEDADSVSGDSAEFDAMMQGDYEVK